MKFITKSQYHQESDCKRYLISRANVGQSLVYTLTHGNEVLGREKCRDSVNERMESIQELKLLAKEHSKMGVK